MLFDPTEMHKDRFPEVDDTVEHSGVVTAVYPQYNEVDINGRRTERSMLRSLPNGNWEYVAPKPPIDPDVTPDLGLEVGDTVLLYNPGTLIRSRIVAVTKDMVFLDNSVAIPKDLLEYRQINRGWNFKL